MRLFWSTFLYSLIAFTLDAAPLCAAIILDDFDDPVLVIGPDMQGESVITESVGALEATRSFRIAGTAGPATPSIAQLDASISSESSMTSRLSTPGVGLRGDAPLFAFQFGYSFEATDISQSGLNDAILLDFRSIQGTGFVPELGLIVRDDVNLRETYFAAIRNLPASSGPFTASIPFSSFTQRGGAPGLPDFSSITRMDFDFFFLYPDANVQWLAEIQSTRVGRIPEPSGMQFVCLAVIVTVLQSSGIVSFQRRVKTCCVKSCVEPYFSRLLTQE